MHVARGDTASTTRSMSTLAAASPNRDVIYVGRSDLRIDTAGSVVPADVTVDLSPLRDRPDRCVCEHPSGGSSKRYAESQRNTASAREIELDALGIERVVGLVVRRPVDQERDDPGETQIVLLDQAVDQAEGVHTGRRAITAEQMNFPGKLRAISWMGSGW